MRTLFIILLFIYGIGMSVYVLTENKQFKRGKQFIEDDIKIAHSERQAVREV